MEKNKHIYVCKDTMEGIFTAIYEAWASGYGHAYNYIQVEGKSEYQLFCDYIISEPDTDKSIKVTRTIINKIGKEAYRYVYYMALSNREDKADAIYRFMILGFHVGSKVLDYLSHDAVSTIMKTYKRVSMESHHYKGFIRFVELSNKVLVSKIRPENDILTIVAPHFVDRLPNENFMIIDEGRGLALVHPAQKRWFLVSMTLVENELLSEYSKSEEEMQQVWGTFVDSISIKERENYKLQQNMCPLRYREFMPEFLGK